MKQMTIDFRTNFRTCDYATKLFFRCDTAADLAVAKNAICGYLDKEIAEANQQEKKEGGEG
jgi:hypothetical protein